MEKSCLRRLGSSAVHDPTEGGVRAGIHEVAFASRVRLDVVIQSTVQVYLRGGEDAPGVKAGGVLSQPASTLNVEALPIV